MIFEFIRSLTCPFDRIEAHLPTAGNILDVGCGHGVFTFIIAQKSGKRKVLGIDPSIKKIALALKHKKHKNVTFKVGYIKDIKTKFDAIVVVDVLYLLPNKQKLEFLKHARKILKRGGDLIIVTNGNRKSFVYSLLYLEELLMVKMLKLTYSDYPRIYFEDEKRLVNLVKQSGLNVKNLEKLKSKIHYPPHFLLHAQNN